MFAFLHFERRRIFGERKNLVFILFISLLAAYFVWTGLNEYRQFQAEKDIFLKLEEEKVGQFTTYMQYGTFGFRLLFEASPLNLFFANSSVLQDVESNVDGFEAIRVDSSFKGNKLFLKRGFFKDFAGILFVFGSLFMLYLGNLALSSQAYLRFVRGCMPLGKFYFLTTAARLFWLDLFFLALGLCMFLMARLGGCVFSPAETAIFLRILVFLILVLDFFYLLGQFTSVLAGLRRVFFLWFFIAWFVCVFLLPEVNRISVFNESRALESAEKVNLEKFRNLMALEKKFRDYLKVNPSTPLNQARQMQKKFALQFINSSYLVNTGLETKYLREVERVIAGHERQSVIFPTTYYQFVTGEVSGKGYYGYLDFMNYIMELRNRFIQFYLKKRYEEPEPPVETFVKDDENVFRSPSRLPASFPLGMLATASYGLALLILAFWRLRRLVFQP